ncbi:hypothetical protein [Paracoccus alkanivorans]|uniref:hypothetical protein n=1 Tax=Paracoccus alkanivorans TaxID=2116655 RepID=UPI0011C38B5B|nr:hypothetical protein [Paracoccus alkanivorans]
MTQVCVRGIFRSGTNFLKSLLEINYDVKVKYDSYGWKHYFFPAINEKTTVIYPNQPCVFIARNPFLSLTSLYNYFESNKRNAEKVDTSSFKSFIREDIIIHDGGNKSSPRLWFPNPVVMWAQINHNAVTSAKSMPERAIFIKYEDLISSPEHVTLLVAKNFSLPSTRSDFVVPEKRLKKLHENTHNSENFFTNEKFNKAAVEPEEYMKNFDNDDLDHIIKSVPSFIIDEIGYDISNTSCNLRSEKAEA